jgi:tetratricopeptide (TPR) repeat protein
MGEILQSLDRHDDALASFREARESRQDASSALFGEGEILFKKGSYDEALRCFDRALKGDRDGYVQASVGKGYALLAMGRYSEALKFFERAIRLLPQNARAWYEKGKLLKKLGNEAEAQAAFAESERLCEKFDESSPCWLY